MIQYLNVTKKYDKDIIAVDDLSFKIENGEFVFLVGSSGSGKTTVIKMLIREEKPSVGKIFFEDEEVSKLRRKYIYNLRRKVGVIFQDFKLIPELTAYENISFAMEAAGKSDKEIKEKVPYLLEIVGLENRLNSFPKQLSGGEKQRVAIARAMANNPKVLIADEPTGNLDPDSAWDILQILSKINSWGTTVIMSTHESDFVNTLHKRVLKLENGKLVRDDNDGSYFEDLDDFSIKILNENNEEHNLRQDEDHKDDKEEKKQDKPSDTHKKEDKKKKDTKKSKEDSKTDEPSEKDILKEASKIQISEIRFSAKVKKILKENKYETLADIIEAGIGDISKLEGLNDSEVKRIAKVITTFVNNL